MSISLLILLNTFPFRSIIISVNLDFAYFHFFIFSHRYRLIVNLIIFACAQSPGSFPYRCYRNVASGFVKLTDSKVVLRCCWPRYYSPSPALLSQLVMPDHFFTLNPIDPLRVIVVARGIFLEVLCDVSSRARRTGAVARGRLLLYQLPTS